jgi:sulfate transport system substrate-binding protein
VRFQEGSFVQSHTGARIVIGLSTAVLAATIGGGAVSAQSEAPSASPASCIESSGAVTGSLAYAAPASGGAPSPAATTAPATGTTAAPATPNPDATPTPTPFEPAGGALTLVAYSTPKSAYDAIIPLWQATPDGTGVEVESSYGASGDQSRAVDAGLAADVVAFSLAPDVDRLVKSGKVDADWACNDTHGMVTDSVVVLAVRPGNPKNIHTWNDLLQPGIGIITPNPLTSGSAKWNIMAAFGAWKKEGLTDDQALANLNTLFKNVLVQDSSGRQATQTFLAGQGDVLISYENEAIAAKAGGQDLDYVVPDDTIMIENPAAVTTVGDVPDKAQSFLNFLTTPDAQATYASKGYRPVISGVTPPDGISFPTPPGLFTIGDLGGWDQVNTQFFDKTNGLVTQIEQGLGN